MIKKKFVGSVLAFAIAFSMTCQSVVPVYAAEDANVSNSASFSTDVIYQIVTDRFANGDTLNDPNGEIFDSNNLSKYHGGDWNGIISKIEDGYLTDMGVSAIWISSPVENIMSIDPSNKCASYHGYWGKDFFKTNPAFGTQEEFENLIRVAHENGIKIVIDFAPNHTSTAEYAGLNFPEDGALYKDGKLVASFSNDKDGIFNHESWTDYSTLENGIYHSLYGLADLNHMNSKVDSYMKDAIAKWLNLGVDGIRVDAVKHMSEGWQKNWLSDIYEEHPVFVFGEWYNGGIGNDTQMTEFANNSGMSLLDFRYANAVRESVATEKMSMKELYNAMVDTANDYNEVNDQVTFIDNHDMSRFMTLAKNNPNAVDQAYVLLMTSRGVPTIYYGSEQYLEGNSDPENRGDLRSFNTETTAYKVISKLAPLRKENSALAYGDTAERWINDDVIIYERKFGDDVAVVAVNRNENESYDISGLLTALPEGEYDDVLGGEMKGNTIQVAGDGSVEEFTLDGGAAAVWEFSAESNSTHIGNVDPGMGVAGNTLTISGRGFGSSGSVLFGKREAEVLSWSDALIKVKVPSVNAGKYTISVKTADGDSDSYSSKFTVLTNSQIAARFIVKNAETDYGTNLYLVGNVDELGGWDPDKAVGPLFNSTASIANYPDWFYDVSVPADTLLEYKFIKKDSKGNVTWEGGDNHKFKTGNNKTERIESNW